MVPAAVCLVQDADTNPAASDDLFALLFLFRFGFVYGRIQGDLK